MKKWGLLFLVCSLVFPVCAQSQRDFKSNLANKLLRKNLRQKLILAAEKGNIVNMRNLISSSVNSRLLANVTDERGRTLLMLAAKVGSPAIAELLLSKGANVNATDDDGHFALEYALCGRHAQTAGLLINADASLEHTIKCPGAAADAQDMSAFEFSVFNGLEIPAQALLKRQAHLRGNRVYDGWTALDQAVRHHFWDVADACVARSFVYSWHAAHEAFLARKQDLFNTLVQSYRFGTPDQGRLLLALVQNPSADTLPYITTLVEFVKAEYKPDSFSHFINYQGVFKKDYKGTPLDLAVRQDVKDYLSAQGAQSAYPDTK